MPDSGRRLRQDRRGRTCPRVSRVEVGAGGSRRGVMVNSSPPSLLSERGAVVESRCPARGPYARGGDDQGRPVLACRPPSDAGARPCDPRPAPRSRTQPWVTSATSSPPRSPLGDRSPSVCSSHAPGGREGARAMAHEPRSASFVHGRETRPADHDGARRTPSSDSAMPADPGVARSASGRIDAWVKSQVDRPLAHAVAYSTSRRAAPARRAADPHLQPVAVPGACRRIAPRPLDERRDLSSSSCLVEPGADVAAFGASRRTASRRAKPSAAAATTSAT